MRTLLVAAATLVVAILLPSSASADAVQPRSAADFRDSVGVVTHAAYYDTAYGDWPRIVEKLDELGVDHLRDAAYSNPRSPGWDERYQQAVDLAAAHGKRFTFLMGAPSFSAGTLDELLAVVRGRLRHATEALEGPNEQDIFNGGPDWPGELRGYQRALYEKAKADPLLRDLPVLAPSLAWDDSAARLGSIGGALDAGNLHSYTGGQAPSAAHIGRKAELAAGVAGDKPMYATETGFHNALATQDGHRPVPEDVAASYLLRTFLEHFRAGIRRTYAYELVDEKPDPGLVDPEQHFGLLRNDLSEKPAFTALKSMLALVGRPGQVTERPLDLELSGDTVDMQQMLLQKSDGRYTLVLWQAAGEWDTARKLRLPVPERDVEVGLPAEADVSVARPVSSGGAAAPAGRTARVAVRVGADPLFVELDFGDPQPQPQPQPSPVAEEAQPSPAADPAIECPRTRKKAGVLLRRSGTEARVRRRSSLRKPVEVGLCSPHSGNAVVELASAAGRGRPSRVFATAQLAVIAGRHVTVAPALSRRARGRLRASGKGLVVRVRYRASGSDRTVVLARRL